MRGAKMTQSECEIYSPELRLTRKFYVYVYGSSRTTHDKKALRL